MDYKPLIIVALLATSCLAQSAFDPLAVGIGARSLGMGGANTAVADSCDTIFGNPAGLGELDTYYFTSLGGSVLEEVNYNILGSAVPLGNKTALGFGYAGSYVTGIELRDSLGTLQRRANFGGSTLLVSCGRKVAEKLSLGASFKYYTYDGTEIDSGDGSGWNIDVGLLQHGWDWLSLGLAAQNIVSSARINYKNGASETLPLTISAGTRLDLLGNSFNSAFGAPVDLMVALDAVINPSEAKGLATRAGLELSPSPWLAVRAGSDRNDLTAGLTLRYAGLGFHYAYHSYGGFEGNTASYFSISYDEKGWEPEAPADVYLGSK